ncbi:hypothetical protein OV207_36050 [Corallococcus sp. BB11-1]|uniref:DUF7151 family protein n=1 Tax=Corallococcus sp. BB11-1 TaxID=2996783 RepID=UPI002271B1C3|nr:hypothetical protein [Corallococcus sp. BB11-1]MCY1036906.1 hypothetical protein [Corallococcus sp. BB11-1]
MRRTWSTWVALAFVAGGCTPLDLGVLSPEHLARSRVLPEPPGAVCPFGGQALQSGLDLNEDGELGPDEVTLTQYACANAPTSEEPTPAQVVVRTRKLDPGTPCPGGGQVTQAGLDVNGNGALDDAEVTREVHACQDAMPVRTRVRPVTSHSLCPSTATVLEAGEDLDGNGVLDGAEVQASHPFCEVAPSLLRIQLQPEPADGRCGRPGTRVDAYGDLDGDGQHDADTEPAVVLTVCQAARVHEGAYVVADAADLAALQGVTRVTGDLRVTSGTLTALVLPELSVVQGALTIASNPALTHVALPGLRFAGDVALNDNAVLATAALGDAAGSRVSVDGNLSVRGNPQLASLEGLRGLAPRNELGVAENALLESFTFPHVTSLPVGLAVHRNPRLRTFDLPALATAEGVSLSQNAALEALMRMERLSVRDNRDLQTLARLNGLRFLQFLELTDNPSLTMLGLDGLVAVEQGFSVENNALLPTCGVQQLAERVYSGSPFELSILGNDSQAPCPP